MDLPAAGASAPGLPRSESGNRLRWSALTQTGRRPNNEDSFLALTFDGHEVRYLGKTGQASVVASDFIFAISDGMGGAQSGDFASRAKLMDRAWSSFSSSSLPSLSERSRCSMRPG